MRTHASSSARFRLLTISGTVVFMATSYGTRTWSKSIIGSAVMTQRAQLFRRLPMSVLRNRPCLPASLGIRPRLAFIGPTVRCGCELSCMSLSWYTLTAC